MGHPRNRMNRTVLENILIDALEGKSTFAKRMTSELDATTAIFFFL
jgi:hypothetical protein